MRSVQWDTLNCIEKKKRYILSWYNKNQKLEILNLWSRLEQEFQRKSILMTPSFGIQKGLHLLS